MEKLEKILAKSLEEKELTKEEIHFLLLQKEEENIRKIFQCACELRKKYFGHKVFLYGFVYFSTYCKNECSFCFYRRSNKRPSRYRKSMEQIIQVAGELRDSGVHLIDLTMGEDPHFMEHPEKIVEIVRRVKDETNLPIMISPGVLEEKVIDSLIDAGADWYALYQETHNLDLFRNLRLNQDYQERFRMKEYARKKGMLIEEGLLVGVGNKPEDIVESFEKMKELNAAQVRTMTFIPQEGTPMEESETVDFLSELLNIAIMRIIFPKALIPASLDVDGINGLEARLNAGANVVTSIIPPQVGYAGVANSIADINEGFRTISGIQDTLHKCGLENATAKEYEKWMESQKYA